MRGVILYGPPASGKDTVTHALAALDPAYKQFRRLKAGPGRTAGYRPASTPDIEALRRDGDIVWENTRYGAVYVVDRGHLIECLTEHVPVLHLGQPEAADAVREATPGATWTLTELSCPYDVAIRRIASRRTGDDAERLTVWQSTPRLARPDLTIDTAEVTPEQAARLIARFRHAAV